MAIFTYKDGEIYSNDTKIDTLGFILTKDTITDSLIAVNVDKIGEALPLSERYQTLLAINNEVKLFDDIVFLGFYSSITIKKEVQVILANFLLEYSLNPLKNELFDCIKENNEEGVIQCFYKMAEIESRLGNVIPLF